VGLVDVVPVDGVPVRPGDAVAVVVDDSGASVLDGVEVCVVDKGGHAGVLGGSVGAGDEVAVWLGGSVGAGDEVAVWLGGGVAGADGEMAVVELGVVVGVVRGGVVVTVVVKVDDVTVGRGGRPMTLIGARVGAAAGAEVADGEEWGARVTTDRGWAPPGDTVAMRRRTSARYVVEWLYDRIAVRRPALVARSRPPAQR
jgi:hypothetical protein